MAQVKHIVTGLVADVPDEALLHWRGAGWLTLDEHAEHEQKMADARAAAEAETAKTAGKGKTDSGKSAGKTEE